MVSLSRKLLSYLAAGFVGFVIGYFAGREHLKYEMRTALVSAAQEMQNGLASAFGENPSSTESESTKKDTPLKTKEMSPVSVVLIKKGFRGSNDQAGIYDEAITFAVSFTNITGKDIRAFDGVLSFSDLLDNNILSLSLAINDPVKADYTLESSGQISYNQFMDSHKRLRNENQANLKITFNTHKILFADGTTQELE
ncbi:conserved hypothetical protein [Crenothrix polyspora]|uniref:Uncharacterized protein n=1 Tax=Crenothrix polyspora TaxID=360316 RepID=A0A1R4HGH9_9GAMM|nr:hypothetical protein [Crenothrix polyspora]SJM95333.1 conserved hypothetical protein [Crenothrix polyspora]